MTESKGNNSKSIKAEIWFLCSAGHLMLIFIWSFVMIAWTVFKLYSRHDFVTESKGNNSKSINTRLWFLRSACHLMLIDIYKKFREDSLNSFQVIEQTPVWQSDWQMPGGKTIYLPTLNGEDIIVACKHQEEVYTESILLTHEQDMEIPCKASPSLHLNSSNAGHPPYGCPLCFLFCFVFCDMLLAIC